eukprot:CAMPEP_0170651138 /NCGR_PEP_ID=MMETSP0224-20130122/46201_1 /TAXON_ID=285029 /ORGANISM="Togula jolla, Strain CCCM 725" /LENGTH=130 /DNA_ID=CAMNT_0010982897 /DNA_START=228 /DNA_END=619 /DNA_ORIENTATION=-
MKPLVAQPQRSTSSRSEVSLYRPPDLQHPSPASAALKCRSQPQPQQRADASDASGRAPGSSQCAPQKHPTTTAVKEHIREEAARGSEIQPPPKLCLPSRRPSSCKAPKSSAQESVTVKPRLTERGAVSPR